MTGNQLDPAWRASVEAADQASRRKVERVGNVEAAYEEGRPCGRPPRKNERANRCGTLVLGKQGIARSGGGVK